MTAVTLDLNPIVKLTDEQFYQLCQANPDLKLELTAKGELILMPPTGGETGYRNSEIGFQLQAWSRQNNLGIAFDSSTCFKLPSGAELSPDASWVRRSRWDALSAEEKRKFPPLCPDFVVELRSESDSLTKLRAKMQEYIDNGASLGWLINPKAQEIAIYRPGQEVEILHNPETVSGENLLPGFVLDVKPIFRSI